MKRLPRAVNAPAKATLLRLVGFGLVAIGSINLLPWRSYYVLGGPEHLGVVDARTPQGVEILLVNPWPTRLTLQYSGFGCGPGAGRVVLPPFSARRVDLFFDASRVPSGRATLEAGVWLSTDPRDMTVVRASAEVARE
jgi:hypothetical protein